MIRDYFDTLFGNYDTLFGNYDIIFGNCFGYFITMKNWFGIFPEQIVTRWNIIKCQESVGLPRTCWVLLEKGFTYEN